MGRIKINNNVAEEEMLTTQSKRRKVAAGIIAALTGVSAIAVVSAVFAYDAFFCRCERPDYALRAGICCYDRIKDRLHRKEFYYKTENAYLKGYYYPSKQSKGLVVVAHGFHAGADDYLPMIEQFVLHGYNVFAYDGRGTYDSKGDSMVGMCQSLIDLDTTLLYLRSTYPYCNQPLFVAGHSWGGYAAASVLALHRQIKACACIAPMNNGYTIMQEKGEQYAGKFAVFSRPLFNAYQKILFGDYVHYDGVKGINDSGVPVLIAQGVDDTVICYDKQSIMAHKDGIKNPNVSYFIGYGLQGTHDGIWHSEKAMAYRRQVDSRLKKMQKDKGKRLTKKEIAAFYRTVDHTLYSQVNERLFKTIVDTFDSALG